MTAATVPPLTPLVRRRALENVSLEQPLPEDKNTSDDNADNNVDDDADDHANDVTGSYSGDDFSNSRPMPSEEERGEEGCRAGGFVVPLRQCGDNTPEEGGHLLVRVFGRGR